MISVLVSSRYVNVTAFALDVVIVDSEQKAGQKEAHHGHGGEQLGECVAAFVIHVWLHFWLMIIETEYDLGPVDAVPVTLGGV